LDTIAVAYCDAKRLGICRGDGWRSKGHSRTLRRCAVMLRAVPGKILTPTWTANVFFPGRVVVGPKQNPGSVVVGK
jgi:hypothetical protein